MDSIKIFEGIYEKTQQFNDLLFAVSEILWACELLDYDKSAIFEYRKGLNFSEIKRKLIELGYKFNDELLCEVLYTLLSNYKRIIRYDYFDKEPEYAMLDRYFWESKSQMNRTYFNGDSIPQIYLLISDTHIGDNNIYNPTLINNLYDYAIKMGAKNCFHLGDLFQKFNNASEADIKGMLTQEKVKALQEDFCHKLDLFIADYPKPALEELRTYCLAGNHDELLNLFLHLNSTYEYSELRKITMYNQSFFMYNSDEWEAKLKEIKIHFSHRFYKSLLYPDLKLDELLTVLAEMKKKKYVKRFMLDNTYDLLISGHLHGALVYIDEDYSRPIDKIYLGVPSTSNINIGRCIGYLVYMYPESNSMEVSVLGCDNNLKISEIDRISFEFGKKNKTYIKRY